MGLRSVKLSGGEPLLHPDIYRVLEYLYNSNIDIIIETNGTLCTKEMVQLLGRFKIRLVSVSLDSSIPESHDSIRGVSGSFDLVKEAIVNLERGGINTQLIMTLMKCNWDQIEPITRFAEAHFVQSLKINITQPSERGKILHDKDETLSVQDIVELGKWTELSLAQHTNIKIHFGYPPAFSLSSRGDIECNVCNILQILGVLADGSFALCGIGKVIPEMIFGHVSRDKVAEVWENASILNELRLGLPHRIQGVCAECIMRDICLGGCIAQNYYTNKNIWESYWFCEEAFKSGCFPLESLVDRPEAIRKRR